MRKGRQAHEGEQRKEQRQIAAARCAKDDGREATDSTVDLFPVALVARSCPVPSASLPSKSAFHAESIDSSAKYTVCIVLSVVKTDSSLRRGGGFLFKFAFTRTLLINWPHITYRLHSGEGLPDTYVPERS